MPFEMEMKARVQNHHQILQALVARYGEPQKILKEDLYFAPREDRSLKSPRMFRVRMETPGKVLVTGKQKNLTPEGLELNVENEFSVDDKEALFRFIAKIDFVCIFEKKKETNAFVDGDMTIELSEVPPIGYFLEIETVRPTDEGAVELRNQIAQIFESFGVGPDQYAPSSYTRLLREGRKRERRPFRNAFIHEGCLAKFTQKLRELPFEEITSQHQQSTFQELKRKFPQAEECSFCGSAFTDKDSPLLSLAIEPTQNKLLDS